MSGSQLNFKPVSVSIDLLLHPASDRGMDHFIHTRAAVNFELTRAMLQLKAGFTSALQVNGYIFSFN